MLKGGDFQSEIHFRLGETFERLGEADEATKSWEESLRLDPDNDILRLKVKKLRDKLGQ